MTATIFDMQGLLLATGDARADTDTGTLEFARVSEGKGTLLHYYFGRGLREVMVDDGSHVIHGRLSTAWANGARAWRVRPLAGPAERALVDDTKARTPAA